MIRFYTDPHIGVERSTHTTPASRIRLKEKIMYKLTDIESLPDDCRAVCLGDFFDSDKPNIATIASALAVFERTDLILYGNHDLSNRVDTVSGLQLLNQAYADQDRTRAMTFLDCSAQLYPVHHHLTQEEFEKTLDKTRPYLGATGKNILLLHCNYESPHDLGPAALNLTRETAEQLLSRFDYVLIGHEHQTRTDFDGRLIILGNIHPTSFSDISDKYFWDWDGKQFKRYKCWSKDKGFASVSWQDLSDLEFYPELEFIDVVGTANQEHLPAINKMVSDLWSKSDKLLMVRNSVQSTEAEIDVTAIAEHQSISVPDRITKGLKDSPLQELWLKYLEQIDDA